MLGNLVALPLAVGIAESLPPIHGVPFLLLVMSLALFTSTGALYLAFDFALGRFIRLLRASGGTVILILACCPWVSALIVFIIHIIYISSKSL
jgi:hypothetical protein